MRSFPAYAVVFACADFHNRQKADMLTPALAVAPFLFVGIVLAGAECWVLSEIICSDLFWSVTNLE